MTEQEVKDEMKKHCFSLHSKSVDAQGNFLTLVFTDTDFESEVPGISCEVSKERDKMLCRLSFPHLKYFMQITTGSWMQFPHPDFASFVKTMNYYAYLCYSFPPF